MDINYHSGCNNTCFLLNILLSFLVCIAMSEYQITKVLITRVSKNIRNRSHKHICWSGIGEESYNMISDRYFRGKCPQCIITKDVLGSLAAEGLTTVEGIRLSEAVDFTTAWRGDDEDKAAFLKNAEDIDASFLGVVCDGTITATSQ